MTKKHAKLPSLQRVKAPITTAADGILKYFFYRFSGKIRLNMSCESKKYYPSFL